MVKMESFILLVEDVLFCWWKMCFFCFLLWLNMVKIIYGKLYDDRLKCVFLLVNIIESFIVLLKF